MAISDAKMLKKTAAGCIIISVNTQRALLNLRAPNKTHPLSWTFWGGMLKHNETPLSGLYREIEEETKSSHLIINTFPLDIYISKNEKFMYFSFVAFVTDEFIPVLNNEICGYAWTPVFTWPKPLHYGAKKALNKPDNRKKIEFLLSQFNKCS